MKHEDLRKMLEDKNIEWYGVKSLPGYTITACIIDEFSIRITEKDGNNDIFIFLQNASDEQISSLVEKMSSCHYYPEESGFTWYDENGDEHYEEDSASEDCSAAICSSCGNIMLSGDDGWFDGWEDVKIWYDINNNEHRGYVLEPRFNYCPQCGKKVVK